MSKFLGLVEYFSGRGWGGGEKVRKKKEIRGRKIKERKKEKKKK